MRSLQVQDAPTKSLRLKSFWRRYSRNRLAVLGLAMVIVLFILVLFGQYVAPYNPFELGSNSFSPPSLAHLMGTDYLGRDVFSGVIFGARASLTVGILAALTSTVLGVLIGSLAGYYGGLLDDFLMKVTEVFLIIPTFVLALVAIAILVSTIWNIILVIGILSWPTIARLVRADYLSLKKRPFVDAAKVAGANEGQIIFGEILPNAMPTVIVATSLQVARAILLEAGLAFLGLADPNWISWGYMLNQSQMYILRSWWLSAFPGFAICAAVLAVNLIGDGLNDALNPRLISL